MASLGGGRTWSTGWTAPRPGTRCSRSSVLAICCTSLSARAGGSALRLAGRPVGAALPEGAKELAGGLEELAGGRPAVVRAPRQGFGLGDRHRHPPPYSDPKVFRMVEPTRLPFRSLTAVLTPVNPRWRRRAGGGEERGAES